MNMNKDKKLSRKIVCKYFHNQKQKEMMLTTLVIMRYLDFLFILDKLFPVRIITKIHIKSINKNEYNSS